MVDVATSSARHLAGVGVLGVAVATLGVFWRRAIMAHRVARGALDHVLVRPVRDVLLVTATAVVAGGLVEAVRRAGEGEP